jgi:hypothetical protein
MDPMTLGRRASVVAILLSLSAVAACSADTTNTSGGTLKPREDKPTSSAPAPADSSNGPEDAPLAAGSDDNSTPSNQPGSTPAKAELNVTWFGQETGYFCGPGSTKMAIGTQTPNPPSQQELATLMGTDEDGTDNISLVAKALNKYISGANYVARDISDPPTKAQSDQLKTDLVKRIGSGFPMVVNVISGWRPPGYPGGTIYHYVAVVGYDESGNKVKIADPAGAGAGGANWTNVPKTYWISFDDFATWVGGKGYTG